MASEKDSTGLPILGGLCVVKRDYWALLRDLITARASAIDHSQPTNKTRAL